jgi:hypothetical protein
MEKVNIEWFHVALNPKHSKWLQHAPTCHDHVATLAYVWLWACKK